MAAPQPPQRQRPVGLEAQEESVGDPQDARAELPFAVVERAREVARIVAEDLDLARLEDDELEVRQLHRVGVVAEVVVVARADEVVQRLPALEHEEADVDGLSVAARDGAEVGHGEAVEADGPGEAPELGPEAEGVHLASDLLRRAFHALQAPMELDTLNTAVRIATATKPTMPAIMTMRSGSRALVKLAMLRSMSFW